MVEILHTVYSATEAKTFLRMMKHIHMLGEKPRNLAGSADGRQTESVLQEAKLKLSLTKGSTEGNNKASCVDFSGFVKMKESALQTI